MPIFSLLESVKKQVGISQRKPAGLFCAGPGLALRR
jgi:hypothetical protein